MWSIIEIPASGKTIRIGIRERNEGGTCEYRLALNGEIIFDGDEFRPSRLHESDSPDSFAALIGFLSLRPGDTDASYFDGYSPEMLKFAYEYGEELSLYADEREINKESIFLSKTFLGEAHKP